MDDLPKNNPKPEIDKIISPIKDKISIKKYDPTNILFSHAIILGCLPFDPIKTYCDHKRLPIWCSILDKKLFDIPKEFIHKNLSLPIDRTIFMTTKAAWKDIEEITSEMCVIINNKTNIVTWAPVKLLIPNGYFSTLHVATLCDDDRHLMPYLQGNLIRFNNCAPSDELKIMAVWIDKNAKKGLEEQAQSNLDK